MRSLHLSTRLSIAAAVCIAAASIATPAMAVLRVLPRPGVLSVSGVVLGPQVLQINAIPAEGTTAITICLNGACSLSQVQDNYPFQQFAARFQLPATRVGAVLTVKTISYNGQTYRMQTFSVRELKGAGPAVG